MRKVRIIPMASQVNDVATKTAKTSCVVAMGGCCLVFLLGFVMIGVFFLLGAFQ